MPLRSARRAVTLGVAMTLAVTGLALADTMPADADALTPGIQGTRHLGEVAPGATVTVAVDVVLRCANSSHAERGSTIVVDVESASIPEGGNAVVTPGRIGPVPDDWPLDGEWCPGGTGDPSLEAAMPVTIELTAPTTVGTGYEYTFLFSRTPDTGITGASAATFTLDVVAGDPDPDPDPDPVDPPALEAAWHGPLVVASPLVANLGRTVPVRVELTADGAAVTPDAGTSPRLEVAPLDACGGTAGPALATLDLRWDDGRWGTQLRTADLGVGCWSLTVVGDDGAYGSTELLVLGARSGGDRVSTARGAR